jgi:23S rRNA-/tRNA-specific pseudouridylate synthase
MFGKHMAPVHRIDRATAGITIFARTLFAKHALENAFKKRLVKKTYYVICEGKANFTKQRVDQALEKVDLKSSKGPMAKTTISTKGEPASTNFKVIQQLTPDYCLLEAQPISGRMHQIRAHCSYLGLPVVGDKLYGAKTTCGPHTIALCAVGLVLPLPKGGTLTIDARTLFSPENYIKSRN